MKLKNVEAVSEKYKDLVIARELLKKYGILYNSLDNTIEEIGKLLTEDRNESNS